MNRLDFISQSLSASSDIYDYIIVGAGISGLQVAEILTQKPHLKILILEAQGSIGGRIKTYTLSDLKQAKQVQWIAKDIDKYKDVKFEKGATWIEMRHRMLLKLCKELNISIVKQFAEGSGVYLTKQKSYTQKELLAQEQYGYYIRKTIHKIDQLATLYNQVIFSDLQTTSLEAKNLLKKYDAMTVSEFLKAEIPATHKHVIDVFDNFFEHTECISCDLNSMHEVILKHARSNDLGILKEYLGEFNSSPEPSYMVIGGSEEITSKYIQRIQLNIKDTFSSILRLHHQAITIDNRNQQFAIVVAENMQNKSILKLKAKKIICAVPLAVSKNIYFTNISPAKTIILDNQIRTNCSKSFMIVKKPFWRSYANGDALFSQDFLINMSHDISPDDESCGIMVFFHSGKKSDEWESKFGHRANEKELKRAYIIDLMCKMFNVKDLALIKKHFQECVYYESSFMTNQYIKSGFQSNTRPGTFNTVLNMNDSFESFYRDQNNVVFVGSQYSLRFASYIEGAVRVARTKIYALLGEKDPLQLTPEEENDV